MDSVQYSVVPGEKLEISTVLINQGFSADTFKLAHEDLPDGEYTATGQGDGTYGVVIEGVSAGQRSCPADIMAQEERYLADLGQVTSAAIQENMITLYCPMGNLVFSQIEAD